jgi:sulfopyruvate decarboxylase subunit beta
MKTREALAVLAQHRGDAIVVCALGMAANEWWAVTRSEDSFYMHGGMGFAASFALGLATALPHVPVWVLNSDGSLSMNLGCLLTEAGQQPANLKHFVDDIERIPDAYEWHRLQKRPFVLFLTKRLLGVKNA